MASLSGIDREDIASSNQGSTFVVLDLDGSGGLMTAYAKVAPECGEASCRCGPSHSGGMRPVLGWSLISLRAPRIVLLRVPAGTFVPK